MRTQVAIIGAGPAGLLLSHLLAPGRCRVRDRRDTLPRVRRGPHPRRHPGVLHGRPARLGRPGHQLHRRGTSTAASTYSGPASGTTSTSWTSWVAACGSTGRRRSRRTSARPGRPAGSSFLRGHRDGAARPRDRPAVGLVRRLRRRGATDRRRRRRRLRRVVRSEPGRHSRCRQAHLGADVPLRVARDPRGRRAVHRRADLCLASRGLRAALDAVGDGEPALFAGRPATDIGEWSDQRIWDALATRLGHGQDGWALTPGPITDKSVLPMRSFVLEPYAARAAFPRR